MKSIGRYFILIISLSLLFPAINPAQDKGLIKKFDLIENDLELSRTASANQYMDKIGLKAALMGSESGNFEMWIWQWKVLRSFDLQFFLGTSTTPILSKDIVRDISVTPEATTITFVYESFTVKEIIYIPYEEEGAVILLDVYSTTPLSIVPGFMPVMQPQWPAGIGGQYSIWDSKANAYLISESQRRASFYVGSPAARQMAAPPAHMFADSPIQFKLEITPNESAEGFIPIVIAGGDGISRDSAFALYKRLLSTAENLYRKNYEYYNNLRHNMMEIISPDKKFNLAYEWGKVALNNLMVENPNLGKGLVAGYGLSGGGGRPGFAWYFGGDAFINALSIIGYGDYSAAKDLLSFAQKWQREENFPIRKKSPEEKNLDIGKMSHELSQSDGLIDWWNDYHYGYNHADTTPWYLVAIGEYYRRSGDLDFIHKSWNSIMQAYQWCMSKDSNNDGLMDLKGAGLGVLEFGALVKIHNDIYTQGLWVQAIKEVNNLARAIDDPALRKKTEKQFPAAVAALEKIYWMNDLGFYSFGANEAGDQVKEKSLFPTAIMLFDFLDSARTISTLKNFNHSDMVTDWGVRNLSNESKYYDPVNYNYGTVWGFNSNFAGTALFNNHFNLQGFEVIRNTYQHAFNYGLGVCPEVYSGDINNKLGEAYHNQGFSTSGYMLPIVRGLAGIDVNSEEKTIIFAPKIPADWDSLIIKNVKYRGFNSGKNASIDFYYYKSDNEIKLIAVNNDGDKVKVIFKPDVALGSQLISEDAELIPNDQSFTISKSFELADRYETVIKYKSGPEIYLPENKTKVGSTNEGIKIISQKYSKGKLIIEAEGLPGHDYEIGIRGGRKMNLRFEGKGNNFIKKEFVIE